MQDRSENDEPVWVAHCDDTLPPLHDGFECELIIPLWKYDADLGMRTRAAVHRQLQVDVPRSIVMIDGDRTGDALDVYRTVSHPRLCTQAVLAPPLEWLIRSGVMIHELRGGIFPMVVDVKGSLIRVCKRLGMQYKQCLDDDEPTNTTPVDICVCADVTHKSVVVTISPLTKRNAGPGLNYDQSRKAKHEHPSKTTTGPGRQNTSTL